MGKKPNHGAVGMDRWESAERSRQETILPGFAMVMVADRKWPRS